MKILNVKILTISDGVNAGVREDTSSLALKEILENCAGKYAQADFNVVEIKVSADGVRNVKLALKKLAKNFEGLIVTTGGTGFGPRDLTPEATHAIVQREAPGLSEAMRLVNPLGRLSRGIAGIYKKTIIINTPGSPKGAVECLEAIMDTLPHALKLLFGERLH